MTRHSAPRLVAILCAGILLSLVSLASTASLADERCAQLVALNKQYAGVRLTDEQREIKVKLIAWYRVNCGHGTRSVRHSIRASQSGAVRQFE
jgi:hypothetical protein